MRYLLLAVLLVSVMVCYSFADEIYGWQEVGGINLTLIPAEDITDPPGAYSWPYGSDYAPGNEERPVLDNGVYFAQLTVDNSIGDYDAYITQVLTISPTSGYGWQHFLASALPAVYAATTKGVWFEFGVVDGVSVLSTRNHAGDTSQWYTDYGVLNFGATPATQVYIKIGVLRPDGMTTGTRSVYIDNTYTNCWLNYFNFLNWHFDWEPAATIITESEGSTEVAEEGPTTDTYTVALAHDAPTANVLVTADPDNTQIEIKKDGGLFAGAGNPVELTFTPANWSTPQTITVRAIDDAVDEGTYHSSRIMHTPASSDPLYNQGDRELLVYVIDNENRTCYDPCDPDAVYLNEGDEPIDTRDLAILCVRWLTTLRHELWQNEPIEPGDDKANVCDLAILASKWATPPRRNLWKNGPLEFRAMMTMPAGTGRWDPGYSNVAAYDNIFSQWYDEGFNAVVYWAIPDFLGGQSYLWLDEFPEARQISYSSYLSNKNKLTQLFANAKQYDMQNFVYTLSIHYTSAFASAHGLASSGVRNDLTIAYTEAIFAEMARTYEDLDGYYSAMAEAVPGSGGTFFQQAIAPALKCPGPRNAPKPLIIVHNWMVPLDDYIQNIVPPEVYDTTWLGYHAYNEEQITDAAPNPVVVEWATQTGLPTVVMLYPANMYNFPFNSPKFAYELATEIKQIPNIRGFIYWEWPGRKLAPLFRKALGYYAGNDEPYSEEPWLALLEAQFGTRHAAEHFLKAWDYSAVIIPELYALVYTGTDRNPRDLQLKYTHIVDLGGNTSPVFGRNLMSIREYAQNIAVDPCFTTPLIIPPDHMTNVRNLGQACFDEATEAMNYVTPANLTEAQKVLKWMEAFKLISYYYERKVAAGIAAMIYKEGGDSAYKVQAEALAEEVWVAYETAADFMIANCNPIMMDLYGQEMQSIVDGTTLSQYKPLELQDKSDIGSIFGWPGY